MNPNYEPEFKKKIVRLHLEERRSLKGLASEYGISKASISNWTKQFREECLTNEEAKADYDFMKENLKLKKTARRTPEGKRLLKKQRHSLQRKSMRGLSVYPKKPQALWTKMAFKKV